MFENFKRIGEEIYVYENFLSKEESNNIVDILEKINEEEWIKENNFSRTEPLSEIIKLRNRINTMIPEGLYLGKASTATRLVKAI